jgi:hypothetical protein
VLVGREVVVEWYLSGTGIDGGNVAADGNADFDVDANIIVDGDWNWGWEERIVLNMFCLPLVPALLLLFPQRISTV